MDAQFAKEVGWQYHKDNTEMDISMKQEYPKQIGEVVNRSKCRYHSCLICQLGMTNTKLNTSIS